MKLKKEPEYKPRFDIKSNLPVMILQDYQMQMIKHLEKYTTKTKEMHEQDSIILAKIKQLEYAINILSS